MITFSKKGDNKIVEDNVQRNYVHGDIHDKSKAQKSSDNLHEEHRTRTRKKFLKNKLDGFADHEVLEFMLYYCYPRQDTNEIAHKLINEFGSLHNLFEADAKDIERRCKVTERVAIFISLIPCVANVYFRARWAQNSLVMGNVKTASEYAIALFAGHKVESCYIFCLDAGMKLRAVSLIASGTINETPMYAREIVSEALKHQSTALIITHNHPGGTATPSPQDERVTEKLASLLEKLQILVIDHIVVAGNKCYSFASNDKFVEGY